MAFCCLGVLLGACAGSTAAPAGPTTTRVVGISGGDAEIQIPADARSAPVPVPAPTGAVWRAAAAVYDELGIRVTSSDSASLTLEARGFEVRRQLAGQRLSSYFTCGSNLSGELADQRRLRIDFSTRVIEAADGAAVQTLVQASARSDAGASADPVACNSRGTLEHVIGTRVKLYIARNWPQVAP
jgi:hypothetical protein